MSTTDPASSAIGDLDALETAGLAAFQLARLARRRRDGSHRVSGPEARPGADRPGTLESTRSGRQEGVWQRFNAVKSALEGAFDAAKTRVDRPVAAADAIDVSRPGTPRPKLGHLHPLTQTANELIDLFGRFGFTVARGPEVEDDFHNFDALNIPPSTRRAIRSTTSTCRADSCSARKQPHPDSRDGESAAPGARDRDRSGLSPRRGGRDALVHVPPDRGLMVEPGVTRPT